jgi:hypothetical protein
MVDERWEKLKMTLVAAPPRMELPEQELVLGHIIELLHRGSTTPC